MTATGITTADRATPDPGTLTTRERLIVAAERLFAIRGIGSVSSREILEAAGQRNASAINYHFGGKPALIRAIVAYRAGPLRERRRRAFAELDAAGASNDLRRLVRAFVQPLAIEVADPGSHYVGFLSQVVPERDLGGPQTSIWDPASNQYETGQRLRRCLPDLPEAVLERRFRFAMTAIIHSLTNHRAAVDGGRADPADLDVLVDDLVDAITGMLAGPCTRSGRPRSPAGPAPAHAEESDAPADPAIPGRPSDH